MDKKPTQYKVSVHLDRIMNDTGISQTQLAKEANINHQFIANLRKHKGVANFDKIVALVNAINRHGFNIKPSDVISFDVVGTTKIKALAHQCEDNEKNNYVFFIKLSVHGEIYFDLIRLIVTQHRAKITIKATNNGSRNFTDDMQKALFAKAFMLGSGLIKMVQVSEEDKRTIAQLLSKMVITQAIKDKIIKPNKLINFIDFSYLGTAKLTFNHVEFKDNSVNFTKDVKDTVIINTNATYPFFDPADSGKKEANTKLE